jgi:hypothetical protein
LTPSGTLIAQTPATFTAPMTLFADRYADTGVLSRGRVWINPVGFMQSVQGVASTAQTLNLNSLLPANSGLVGPAIWSVTKVSSGSAVLSSSGSLSIPSGQVVQEIAVSAQDAQGRKFSGAVSVGLVTSSFSANLFAKAGQSEPAVFNLNNASGTLPSGTRRWAFKAGQSIPSWLSLNPVTGVLSVSQQSSTIAEAGVAADYIVEGYDLYSSAVPVPKTYGTVSVGVSTFRNVLFTDRTAAVSLNLNPAPPVAGVGENATWSVVSGALPSGVTLSAVGTLTASTSANCQQDVLLRAQDAEGNSALVLVYVNAPSPAQTFSFGVSKNSPEPQKVDLNSLPEMSLGWLEATRVWTPTLGQVLPSWMSVDGSGVLSMMPTRLSCSNKTGSTPMALHSVPW